jgi:hypothetical protein
VEDKWVVSWKERVIGNVNMKGLVEMWESNDVMDWMDEMSLGG